MTRSIVPFDQPVISMRTLILLLASFVLVARPSSLACAEVFPRDVNVLQQLSDVIVVGTIERIRIESEPSRVERNPGNFDWGIYLKLKIHRVEKGRMDQESVEVRCFRIKARTSWIEYFSPSGHHPIPAVATRARFYLKRNDQVHDVVLPNGIAPEVDATQKPGSKTFKEASEVVRLKNNSAEIFGSLDEKLKTEDSK